MHSKSDNIELLPHDNANEVADELVKLLISRYDIGLEASMKGGGIIFD